MSIRWTRSSISIRRTRPSMSIRWTSLSIRSVPTRPSMSMRLDKLVDLDPVNETVDVDPSRRARSMSIRRTRASTSRDSTTPGTNASSRRWVPTCAASIIRTRTSRPSCTNGRAAPSASRPALWAPGRCAATRPTVTPAPQPSSPALQAARAACEVMPTARSAATSSGPASNGLIPSALRGTMSVPGRRSLGMTA